MAEDAVTEVGTLDEAVSFFGPALVRGGGMALAYGELEARLSL